MTELGRAIYVLMWKELPGDLASLLGYGGPQIEAFPRNWGSGSGEGAGMQVFRCYLDLLHRSLGGPAICVVSSFLRRGEYSRFCWPGEAGQKEHGC